MITEGGLHVACRIVLYESPLVSTLPYWFYMLTGDGLHVACRIDLYESPLVSMLPYAWPAVYDNLTFGSTWVYEFPGQYWTKQTAITELKWKSICILLILYDVMRYCMNVIVYDIDMNCLLYVNDLLYVGFSSLSATHKNRKNFSQILRDRVDLFLQS